MGLQHKNIQTLNKRDVVCLGDVNRCVWAGSISARRLFYKLHLYNFYLCTTNTNIAAFVYKKYNKQESTEEERSGRNSFEYECAWHSQHLIPTFHSLLFDTVQSDSATCGRDASSDKEWKHKE